MKAILKEPGKKAEIIEIDNTLEVLQSLVGGWIEHISFIEGVGLIVNEEGLLRDMTPNFDYGWDVIVGPAVFVGETGEEFTDITKDKEEKIMEFLQWHTI